jgi:DNA invertase Pin-like site-specific DNA recombinase
MTLNRNTALIYYRVSTHQQAKKISPDFQRQECQKLSAKEGFSVDQVRDIYWDDESAFLGKGSKRGGFQDLTNRWKEDPTVGAVVVYDLSRLFRDARSYFNSFCLSERARHRVAKVVPPVRVQG